MKKTLAERLVEWLMRDDEPKIRWQARIYGRDLDVIDGPLCRWRWMAHLRAQIFCANRSMAPLYSMCRLEVEEDRYGLIINRRFFFSRNH